MSVFTDLQAAGIPTDHHESDLYCLRTAAAIEIIGRHDHSFTMFTSKIDGETWIEIPFAFDPFWDKKKKKN